MTNYHLKAQDIMQTDVITILSDLTALDAALLMKREGVRSLIVERDNEDDAYGMVTYTDIVDNVLALGLEAAEVKVSEIMTKPLVVLSPNLNVRYVAALFAQTGIGHAPVIGGHKLVGIVSKTDLIVELITAPNGGE